MWILTESINDHNQHGEYFIIGFDDKPPKDILLKTLKRFMVIEMTKLEEEFDEDKKEYIFTNERINSSYTLTKMNSGEFFK